MKKIKLSFTNQYDTDEQDAMNHPVFLMQNHVTNGGFGHFHFSLVYIRVRNGVEEIEFYDDYVHTGEVIANGFVITCQYETRGEKAFQPYAVRCEYDSIGSISTERWEGAEMRVRLMKKLNASLEELNSEFGYSTTFEDYATRVAAILGVTMFVRRNEVNSHGNFRRYNVNAMKNFVIDTLIEGREEK